MPLAIVSLLTALTIALGRQTAVFLRMKDSLWFFSNFEKKRLVFTLFSLICGIGAVVLQENSATVSWLLGISAFLLLTTYLFDFKYIFPEIPSVQKVQGVEAEISDSTEVMGVAIDTHAVAYPLGTLMARHIIHDRVQDKDVLVCYCALCRSGLVFDARVEGSALYFRVAGVWRRNMLMEDTQTHSLWQQATGECIYGKMKGYQLALLPGENTQWGAWFKQHPETQYAARCEEARKGYLSIKQMLVGLEKTTTKVTPPGFSDLSGLPARETVFGIDCNGTAKAYPQRELKGSGVFTDDFGTKRVELRYDQDAGGLTAKDLATDEQLRVEKHWWLGWKEFHPETHIYKP